MDKPIKLRPISHGVVEAVVKMGLDNSVDARNFLAQISHLRSYRGPQGRRVVFCIDENSIRQAAEWGFKIKPTLTRLREFSGRRLPRGAAKLVRNACRTGVIQEQGKYSRWMTARVAGQFWDELRVTQGLWARRAFDKPINPASLQSTMLLSMRRRGSTWEKAIRFAGFVPEEEAKWFRREIWSPEKVINNLQELKAKGLPIHTLGLIQHGHANLLAAIHYYFSTWEVAVRSAGFNPEEEWRGRRKRFSREEVIKEIVKKQARGEKVTQQAITKENRVLLYSAQEYFGSWDDALIAAGATPVYTTWSPTRALSELRRMKKSGEPIYPRYISIRHPRLDGALRRCFGSWESAIRAAGLDPEKERAVGRWWPEKILKELRRLKEEGNPISQGYLQKNYNKLANAIYKHFGSWWDAVTAAGYDPVKESPKPHLLRRRDTSG